MAWVEKRRTKFRAGSACTTALSPPTPFTPSAPTRSCGRRRSTSKSPETPSSTPAAAELTRNEWVQIWQATHQASPVTWAAYRSHLRIHILPNLGHLTLVDIGRQHVKTLAAALVRRLAPRSTADVIMVLSMILQEAVEDRSGTLTARATP
ncbi:hypothetical protein AB0J20_30560 [Micromonospora costi]|uniref:hypothetical protein n=1 Tax=Micromonospora costi TaxID=1530042 RepID=UPI00340835BA